MPLPPTAGEPAALAAGARQLAGAAEALRGVRGQLAGAASFVVVAGAWRGPASEAFLAGDQATRLGLQRAAGALDDTAGTIAELATRLDHAQATWDEARRLAASAGLELDRDGVVTPAAGALSASPAAAGLAARLAAAAVQDATAARAAAAARLDQVAAPTAPRGHGGSPAAGPAHPGGGSPGAGGGPHDGARGGGGGRGPLVAALEAGREAVTGTYHLLGGADARLRAAGRLATSSDDPSVRMAAARVLATAGRPLLDSRLAYILPPVGAVLDTAVGVADGDPLPRAIVRAVGGTVGAELGGRAGMAACGGPAAATQGVGLVACPVVTVVAGAAGAELGRRAAVRLYDEVVGPPEPEPERVRPASR
jgi:hypothetical protein